MTKSSVAIIGTGPAGLACGHFLHHRFDVTVYEKNDYVGGHANSISRIEVNEQQSRTLATLRDTLLPKLISGELRVKDAERWRESVLWRQSDERGSHADQG